MGGAGSGRPVGLVYENSTLLTLAGETLTLASWSARKGISVEAIIKRLKSGWDVERTLTQPVRVWRRKSSERESE